MALSRGRVISSAFLRLASLGPSRGSFVFVALSHRQLRSLRAGAPFFERLFLSGICFPWSAFALCLLILLDADLVHRHLLHPFQQPDLVLTPTNSRFVAPLLAGYVVARSRPAGGAGADGRLHPSSSSRWFSLLRFCCGQPPSICGSRFRSVMFLRDFDSSNTWLLLSFGFGDGCPAAGFFGPASRSLRRLSPSRPRPSFSAILRRLLGPPDARISPPASSPGFHDDIYCPFEEMGLPFLVIILLADLVPRLLQNSITRFEFPLPSESLTSVRLNISDTTYVCFCSIFQDFRVLTQCVPSICFLALVSPFSGLLFLTLLYCCSPEV